MLLAIALHSHVYVFVGECACHCHLIKEHLCFPSEERCEIEELLLAVKLHAAAG